MATKLQSTSYVTDVVKVNAKETGHTWFRVRQTMLLSFIGPSLGQGTTKPTILNMCPPKKLVCAFTQSDLSLNLALFELPRNQNYFIRTETTQTPWMLS